MRSVFLLFLFFLQTYINYAAAEGMTVKAQHSYGKVQLHPACEDKVSPATVFTSHDIDTKINRHRNCPLEGAANADFTEIVD